MSAEYLLSALLRLIPWSIRNQAKRLPGLAAFQRFIVGKGLHGKEFCHRVDAGPAKGMTFQLRLPEDKGIWTGTYEAQFASRLARAVAPGAIAYDIGSWHGFFAGVMAAQGARIVHVFEPLPTNAERIRRLIRLNPTKGITLHECAVGDRDTRMELLVMPESSMAKLEKSRFQTELTSAARVPVVVRSIDSMVSTREIEPPDLIKIDVEGAELLVLEGARETLRRYRPELFAEIHSSELLAECERLLRSEGYQLKVLDGSAFDGRANDVVQIHARAN